MQASALPVYSIGIFGDEGKQFWMGGLGGFADKLPTLGHPHRQNFYMIMLIETAFGEVLVDKQRIPLNYNATAIIIKPDCISCIAINSEAKGYIICFTEQFFLLRYNANILNQFSLLKREAVPHIDLTDQSIHWHELISLCYGEFTLGRSEAETVLRSYLNIILFELDRLYHPSGFLKSKNIKQEKIHQFETLIDRHFTMNKMPSHYADLLNLSPNYLNKICRSETGQTAGALIRKRIIVEAQRLLQYTNLSVNEVANELGYESLSYFVTSFKKQTGQTPEQFRNK
ncbi:helix-turn-helix transcriptional regulator [Pedobacter duraquae]|uniref:AraC-like DNA-binding protein n=1 Tax=Pedobacter duraquae TaxID=425511 RepID=A0A4R6IE49_9SPHI|nr:helix-turn-helix transcriptional regulator [Pedobacter duraquae]TDO20244.1 AraC-like DNA-binding protein [Pedobacter duraquae]